MIEYSDNYQAAVSSIAW